jgi:hypothetical protein
MSLTAQYTTTTPAFTLLATPATGSALPATDPSASGNRPLAAFLQADTHDIRFTTDGTAPTSSVGMLLVAGAAPFLYAGPLAQLRFIQVASGAKLNVVYAGIADTVGPQGPPGIQGASGGAGPAGPRGTPGGAQAWDGTTAYSAGAVVFDRGGIWQAVDTNTNSRPISGNAHWTLIGGTPYVDVTLDPVALTTAPFYDASSSGPGLVVIPAPGANKLALPIGFDPSVMSGGDAWAHSAVPSFAYGVAGGANFGGLNSIEDGLGDFLNSFGIVPQPTINNILGTTFSPTTDYINQPVVIWTATDITNSGATVGTRSVRYRLYYTIFDMTPPDVGTFFHITALNQGTKTFTVNGDAHTLTGSISAVGSTGNNGTYTIVSATFDTDRTDIVVSQAIPDSTADGWVKQ